MVEHINRELLELRGLLDRTALDPRVMEAMRRVPRHEFVAPGDEAFAYLDSALHIGCRQTISQPLIVALMTDLLAVEPGDVVLEIGTGSGYQTAVLAELAARVCSIEIIPDLADTAARRLRALGYENIDLRAGDGAGGWPDGAPFDGIMVTAAAKRVPSPLIDQLRAGRRLVIPVGPPAGAQQLTRLVKGEGGAVTAEPMLAVRFVPLTHADRSPEPLDDGEGLARREVVTAFLRHAGKLLLVRRSDAVGTYRGRWSAISGYLEDEPVRQALTEIREETGLRARALHLVAAGDPVTVADRDLGIRWTIHPFLFEVDDPEAVRLDWENVEQRWVTERELGEFDTVPALAEAYERCRRREESPVGPGR